LIFLGPRRVLKHFLWGQSGHECLALVEELPDISVVHLTAKFNLILDLTQIVVLTGKTSDLVHHSSYFTLFTVDALIKEKNQVHNGNELIGFALAHEVHNNDKLVLPALAHDGNHIAGPDLAN